MFFAKAGEYEPCGIYNLKHVVLAIITIIFIFIALKCTKNKDKNKVKRIIKFCTITLWILEIVKIIFKLQQYEPTDVNKYVPLYYCSIFLYAGILSSFGIGKMKRIGDVFLATGGVVGGIVFIIFPTTSLPEYPMFHFISLHSFLFHGIMIYIGILINITNYIELKKKDIIYYAELVGVICIISLVINNIFESNLMFISQNFPGMPIEIIYNATGIFFTPIMIAIQITLPFIIVYMINKLIKKFNGEYLKNH